MGGTWNGWCGGRDVMGGVGGGMGGVGRARQGGGPSGITQAHTGSRRAPQTGSGVGGKQVEVVYKK